MKIKFKINPQALPSPKKTTISTEIGGAEQRRCIPHDHEINLQHQNYKIYPYKKQHLLNYCLLINADECSQNKH
ncbi:hypothetical protein, partial [Enterobacter hormaechei]|uniref:hypothetical protein n=1 Tax=Enterobacter hormaechei TaxID=158836 RepID=UPI001ED98CDC